MHSLLDQAWVQLRQKMSALPWKYCSVCRGQFGPDDTSGGRPVLFRCVHCSDFSSGDARSCADRSLHICIACHAKSGLYHASSHCWAKVFVSTARGAYDYKKGIEWVGKVSSSATYIASSDRSVDSPGTCHCRAKTAFQIRNPLYALYEPSDTFFGLSRQVLLPSWMLVTTFPARIAKKVSMELVGSLQVHVGVTAVTVTFCLLNFPTKMSGLCEDRYSMDCLQLGRC